MSRFLSTKREQSHLSDLKPNETTSVIFARIVSSCYLGIILLIQLLIHVFRV